MKFIHVTVDTETFYINAALIGVIARAETRDDLHKDARSIVYLSKDDYVATKETPNELLFLIKN